MATADFSRIATNIGALNSLQSLNNINKQLGVHQNRLATGKRINSAADDPAGLTIATKLNARSEGLKVASDNIADAQNLLSVAESGLGRINDILVQMRNKSEQAASDTLGQEERAAIVEQMQAYSAQIDDIVGQTKWNGSKLIDGSHDTSVGGTALRFQTGADQNDATTLDGLADMSVGTGGLNIAQEAPASSSTTQDLNSIVSSLTTTGTVTTGSTQLGSGSYSVRVDATAGSNAAVVSLVDSSGNAVLFDDDASASTGMNSSTTVDLSAGGTVDFGNGLTVTLNSIATDGAVYDAGVSVSNSGEGTYSLASTHVASLNSASTAATFSAYMADIDTAMNTVSGQLSKVGALSGRLTFKADQVSTAQINVEASYNRIMNADMAYEQLESTKFSILQQTSTTMLAQANSAPQGILSLFR